MKRPTKCPICGEKIKRVLNSTTGNSYFKCSNDECLFALSEEYTDAELYLQGQTLKTTCLKCDKPLTIINGPHGLYPRCTNCTCDFEPTMYNGRLYNHWVNARRSQAKEEIEERIQSFNAGDPDDKLYDFEAFIASVEPPRYTGLKSEKKKTPKHTPTNKKLTKSTCSDKVLNILSNDPEEIFTASDISSQLSMSTVVVRNSLNYLRELDFIKIVKCEPVGINSRYLTMYYQSIDGPLEPVTIQPKSKMLDSVYGYCSSKKKRTCASEVIKYLEDHNIEWIPTLKGKGACKGYKTSDLSKALNYVLHGDTNVKQLPLPTAVYESPVPTSSKNISYKRDELKEEIVKLLQQNLQKPYYMDQLSEILHADKGSVKQSIKSLKQNKRIKIVGWKFVEGQRGASALKYQLTESPLPKFKVTVDNNLYVTLHQFFNKKLRGKRITSIQEVANRVKDIKPIPLLVNQRAYAGYPLATLKEIFKDYIDAPVKKRQKCTTKVEVSETVEPIVPEEVEAAAMVSNPIQKKSFFGIVSSLFSKKEKVHS